MTPSIFSRYFFIFNPPPYPPRLPSLPITRWHGIIIGNMFFAFADPAALSLLGSQLLQQSLISPDFYVNFFTSLNTFDKRGIDIRTFVKILPFFIKILMCLFWRITKIFWWNSRNISFFSFTLFGIPQYFFQKLSLVDDYL